jgi:putative transferase (TIGR04331 family)
MNKNLVLSAKNPNFKDKEGILLAGEWVLECEDNETELSQYEIFFSKGQYKPQRVINCVKSDEIYQSIIKDLSSELNLLHSTNLSIRSWKIILGYWLKRFIELCYQKNYLINEIFENHKINKIYGIKDKNYKTYSNDTKAIHPLSRDIIWNNNLFLKITNYFNLPVEKDFFEINQKENLSNEWYKKAWITHNSFKDFIMSSVNAFNFLKRKNDALITATGFSYIYEKFFELSLFQMPQFYKTPIINYNEYDKNLRSKIDLLQNKKEKNIENFIRSILSEFLPVCFVENFKNIFETCEKNLPEKPKFILTGINHDFDEAFKFYTAKKVSKGIPYYILQHGTTYFTEDFTYNRPEYETTDKFITFGYSKEEFCEVFGNVNTFGKSYGYNKQGKLNILPPPMLGLFFPYDRNQEFLKSFELIKNFEKKLPPDLKNEIVLRLHKNFTTGRGKWFREKYFKDFKENQIDYMKKHYKDFISESRVNIIFYDSSGILENLHHNIPTIVIYTDKEELLYNHIQDEFIEKYKLLKEAKILFSDPDEMVEHLKKYWNNIDEWWFSSKTQKNIKNFNKELNLKANIFSFIKLKNRLNQISKTKKQK